MNAKLIVTVTNAESIDELVAEIEASGAPGVDALIEVEVYEQGDDDV